MGPVHGVLTSSASANAGAHEADESKQMGWMYESVFFSRCRRNKQKTFIFNIWALESGVHLLKKRSEHIILVFLVLVPQSMLSEDQQLFLICYYY